MTYPELAQQSLDIQDACNLSGVVHAFSRAMEVLWAEDRKRGSEAKGTEWINKHPIVTLFIDKLASLNGYQQDPFHAVCDAYDGVRKITEEKP